MQFIASIFADGYTVLGNELAMLGEFSAMPGSFRPSSSGPEGLVFGFIVIVGIIVVGGILLNIGKGVTAWADNNQQPVLSVRARMVAKREEVSVRTSHHSDFQQNNHNHHHTRSITTYHATFEFESGDRKEFEISESQYGLLAEGDDGELTFQGTRYKGFQRKSFAEGAEQATRSAAVEADGAAQLESARSFCPHCGVKVSGEFKFCPHCGKAQPVYTVNT